jgi:hypothetical protein
MTDGDVVWGGRTGRCAIALQATCQSGQRRETREPPLGRERDVGRKSRIVRPCIVLARHEKRGSWIVDPVPGASTTTSRAIAKSKRGIRRVRRAPA